MKFLYFILVLINMSCSKYSTQEISHVSEQILGNAVNKDETISPSEVKKTKSFSRVRYHILEFTTSESRIKERCVDFSKIQKLNCGYVKETVDSLSRCVKLEFYKTQGVFFRAVDLPSIVKYVWTDSSLIEKLYSDDGTLLSFNGFMIRPNKIEYFLSDSNVVKIKEFFNEELVGIEMCDDYSINNTIFFLMYSGCDIKSFNEYKMRF